MRKKNLENLDKQLAELKAQQLKVRKEMSNEKKRRDAAAVKFVGQMAFNVGLHEWNTEVLREVLQALAEHGPSTGLATSIRALPKTAAQQNTPE
jgi:hypothetical protein